MISQALPSPFRDTSHAAFSAFLRWLKAEPDGLLTCSGKTQMCSCGEKLTLTLLAGIPLVPISCLHQTLPSPHVKAHSTGPAQQLEPPPLSALAKGEGAPHVVSTSLEANVYFKNVYNRFRELAALDVWEQWGFQDPELNVQG